MIFTLETVVTTLWICFIGAFVGSGCINLRLVEIPDRRADPDKRYVYFIFETQGFKCRIPAKGIFFFISIKSRGGHCAAPFYFDIGYKAARSVCRIAFYSIMRPADFFQNESEHEITRECGQH